MGKHKRKGGHGRGGGGNNPHHPAGVTGPMEESWGRHGVDRGVDGLGRGGLVCRAATAWRFTEKLLANPNLALWRDSYWHMLPTDLKQTHYDLGEKWCGSEDTGDSNSTAQQSLLDGGEGKLIDNRTKDNGTETPHNEPRLNVADLPYTVIRGTEGDPLLVSSQVPEVGSRLPALVSKGAIDNVSRLVATAGSTVFTPCHLLRRAAPHGSEDATEVPGNTALTERCLVGLAPPSLDSTGGHGTGADTPQQLIENKRCQKALLATQSPRTQWTMYQGEFNLPSPLTPLASHWREMCPSNLALHHPAAEFLKKWATYGCPTGTGKPWTKAEMQEAVDQGPH
jgi:hypothetical protein